MSLDNEILDALEDLKYPDLGSIKDNVSLLTDLSTFSTIISWISQQLHKIDGLESTVNHIKDESEMVSFRIELNSLLREINSPLIDSDFSDSKTKLSLLNSLCGQLMASFMTYAKQKSGSNDSMTISMTESQTAKDLKYILITLGEKRKPPNNVSPKLLFQIIKDLLKRKLSELNFIEDSLLLPEGLNLSPEQWNCLETINEEMKKDYSIRRQMLVKRCDTTVNSFTWRTDNDTEDMKSKINEVIGRKRKQMSDLPNITIADALAARQSDCDSLINGMVSKNPTNCMIRAPNTKVMANKGLQQLIQAEELHKYLIGAVPDRGGRPNEQPKPARENFAQQQFQRENPQRGRGRGAHTGDRGGGGRGNSAPNLPQNMNRIQGSGWAQNSGDRYSNNTQRRGGYQSNNYEQNDGQKYRRQQRDDYQQNTGYQPNSYPQRQPQQHWNANNQYYEQQYDKQSYVNRSDQSYDNSRGYHNQSRPYRGSGSSGGGGSGRRY